MKNNVVFLASKSPRRRKLLSQLGYEVIVLTDPNAPRGFMPDDEVQHADESPQDYVYRTAHEKLLEGMAAKARLYPDACYARIPVIAADTVVSLDGEVLGKPKDEAEAAAFLRRLSGKVHEVRTCVWAGCGELRTFKLNLSRVHFRTLREAEIAGYVASKEPFDKAGGYGIQGLAGVFIDRIDGSFTGIMGLPVCETTELLQVFHLPVPAFCPEDGTGR